MHSQDLRLCFQAAGNAPVRKGQHRGLAVLPCGQRTAGRATSTATPAATTAPGPARSSCPGKRRAWVTADAGSLGPGAHSCPAGPSPWAKADRRWPGASGGTGAPRAAPGPLSAPTISCGHGRPREPVSNKSRSAGRQDPRRPESCTAQCRPCSPSAGGRSERRIAGPPGGGGGTPALRPGGWAGTSEGPLLA